jgi:hypothetical protein
MNMFWCQIARSVNFSPDRRDAIARTLKLFGNAKVSEVQLVAARPKVTEKWLIVFYEDVGRLDVLVTDFHPVRVC